MQNVLHIYYIKSHVYQITPGSTTCFAYILVTGTTLINPGYGFNNVVAMDGTSFQVILKQTAGAGTYVAGTYTFSLWKNA